jgi:fatty-acyl-CoA synthase
MVEWYPRRTFGSLVDDMAERFGAREALVFREQRITFGELRERVDELARGLIALGVEPGDTVALWLMNRPEWIFAMFALARIGAVQVPINTRFRANDLAYVLAQSDARFLIAHDVSGPVDFLGMVREVVKLPPDGVEIDDPDFPELRRVVILGQPGHPGCVDFDWLRERGREVSHSLLERRAAAVDPDRPVFMMYTSGTTGFPKGVVHGHVMLRFIQERAFRLGITESDTFLNYLPLFHLFSYSEIALTAMLTGARQVLMETFDAEESIRLVERERCTSFHGFETHLKELADAQERLRADVSSLRMGIFAAGTQSSAPIVRRALEMLKPIRLVSGYGMSEMGSCATIGSLADSPEQSAETSGYPAPGYFFRIVDPETKRDQPVGVPGEIVVKGYSLMQGYYKKPKETAECFDEAGWFHTGDTGVRRADGYIRFLGRYKDMLKVGGENVDPMEVEALLLGAHGVQQVAVVALPDERLGEVPVAFVQCKRGVELVPAALIEFCRGKVATFKIPRHVLFVEEFPMTASGKFRKVELRETALRALIGRARD